jgi:hypothetical protein
MPREVFLHRLWQIDHRAARKNRNGKHSSGDHNGANGREWQQIVETLDAYRTEDFSHWPARLREDLGRAVDEFRSVVDASNGERSNKAITAHVRHLIDTVHPFLRDEWVAAVLAFVTQVEEWCRARDWASRRYPKEIEEALLGRYEVPQLLVHRLEGRVVFDPITRFVAGGDGLIDAYAMPSLEVRPIARRNGDWELSPSTPTGRRRKWSEAAFEKLISDLSREAA